MRLRINFGKSDRNFHGKRLGYCTFETIKGWKVVVLDLLKEINKLGGNKSRAVWYKRVILYFPDGSWWHWDIALVKAL